MKKQIKKPIVKKAKKFSPPITHRKKAKKTSINKMIADFIKKIGAI